MKRMMFMCTALCMAMAANAQDGAVRLSLDSCRHLAIAGNKELQMTGKKQETAYYERKAAATNYLPRVNATAAYLHSSKELSLLSNGQKTALSGLDEQLHGLGSQLVDALHTDTRNMGMVATMLTQPLYMGGKIRAYDHITRFAEQIARSQHTLALQEVIVEVDEAYWQVVALQARKALAESFVMHVARLDNDVRQMIAEGMATQADGLSVRVKLNEAKVAQIQVENGLQLSKMKLCQVCGLALDTEIELTDDLPQEAGTLNPSAALDVETAFSHRPELEQLGLAADIYSQKVRITRSAYMPKVALTGGYAASNPSVFNSFERKMKGMWNVGVAVEVPVVTFGERIYKTRAARAEEVLARMEVDETSEKVELQVNQCRQRLQEANERLEVARKSREEADENLRYATLGVKEGVIPVSNVLEAQTAWLSAHLQGVTARIDVRLATLYLGKAKGLIAE
ncbi:MAG: TolC family protein [Bacteroidaceae bacterium]